MKKICIYLMLLITTLVLCIVPAYCANSFDAVMNLEGIYTPNITSSIVCVSIEGAQDFDNHYIEFNKGVSLNTSDLLLENINCEIGTKKVVIKIEITNNEESTLVVNSSSFNVLSNTLFYVPLKNKFMLINTIKPKETYVIDCEITLYKEYSSSDFLGLILYSLILY